MANAMLFFLCLFFIFGDCLKESCSWMTNSLRFTFSHCSLLLKRYCHSTASEWEALISAWHVEYSGPFYGQSITLISRDVYRQRTAYLFGTVSFHWDFSSMIRSQCFFFPQNISCLFLFFVYYKLKINLILFAWSIKSTAHFLSA